MTTGVPDLHDSFLIKRWLDACLLCTDPCQEGHACDLAVPMQDYINIELDNHRNQLIRV